MKYFLFIIKFTKLKNLIFVLLLLLISTILEYLFVSSVPFFFKIIFQEQNQNQNQIIEYFNSFGFIEKHDIFRIILLLLVIFFLIKNIFYFANSYFFLRYSFSIHNNLTRNLFTRYLNSNYRIFINSESSLLIRNVISNTTIVRTLIANLTTLFSETLVFVGLCAIVIYQSSLISIVSIAFIIFFSVIYLYYTRSFSKNWTLKIQNYEQSRRKLLESKDCKKCILNGIFIFRLQLYI
jgi:ABC-type multidrug transport system fused ATPase/permease subunit